MHLGVQFNHFNHALWVTVRCEASEVTPTVAEASEASKANYTIIGVSRSEPHASESNGEFSLYDLHVCMYVCVGHLVPRLRSSCAQTSQPPH